MADQDSERFLPHDILLAVARGRDELKAMRGVSRSWQAGFEGSVTRLRVTGYMGIPSVFHDGTIPLRFPALTSLDLGEARMDEESLSILVALRNLRTIGLGCDLSFRAGVPFCQQPLTWRLTDAGLEQLQKLPALTALDLRHCGLVTDSGIGHLAGLRLTSLSLQGCRRISTPALECLWDMPLISLDLSGCDW